MLHQTVRSAEFAALYAKLRAAGLHPVAVKGQLCSRLYPLNDHRISGDDDLYIPDSEFFACHEALIGERTFHRYARRRAFRGGRGDIYEKDGPLYIELHRRLFDSSEDAHDDLNRFFADIHPVEIDGFFCHAAARAPAVSRSFTPTSTLCVAASVCVSSADIGLWAREYHDEIDWQHLHDQCVDVHAATFAAAAFKIAREYLGIAFALYEPWNGSVDLEPLPHDTLCGGVYGSNDYRGFTHRR